MAASIGASPSPNTQLPAPSQSVIRARAKYYGARRLLTFDEMPAAWKENVNIVTGYRYYTAISQCFCSIFRLHNETLNIWTHLLPFFLFDKTARHMRVASDDRGVIYDSSFFLLFLAAASACLLCSSIYHTFLCHSRKSVLRSCITIDYMGISILINASVSTVVYYGFYKQSLLQIIYLSIIAVVTLAGVILPWFRWFDRYENRHYRIIIFVLMAVAGFVPGIHLIVIRGLVNTINFVWPVLASLGSYLIGVLIYAFQFPEKQWPGRFDVWGHSHQWWHLAVVGGIFFHYYATLRFNDLKYKY
ncbi:HlyIII-domain-containing protein [Ramicandelaber brevisporus]|nr:HlyIII-domain-containing protein [Ramicandelaber brevisporus]